MFDRAFHELSIDVFVYEIPIKLSEVIIKIVIYPLSEVHVFRSFMQMTSSLFNQLNSVQKNFYRNSKELSNGIKLHYIRQ